MMGAALEQTSVLGARPATLQQGTRQFTALYERNAYLVYNLSLRITCDRSTAINGASAAFLTCVASAHAEAGLVKTATTQALTLAAHRPPTPNGAGDDESERMLTATATLPPPGRAALALAGLVGASAADVGDVMGVSEEAAAALVDRSFEALSRTLGRPRADVESTYRSWLWVEPPVELWETLYPTFHRTLARVLSEGQNGQAANGEAAPAPGGMSRRARRKARRAVEGPRRSRWRRRGVWAVSLLAVGGAGFLAAERTGVIGSHRTETLAGSGGLARPQSTFGSHLNPDKLDQLRMRELQQTKAYAAHQAELQDRQKKSAAARLKARQLAAKRKKAALAKQRQALQRRKAAARRRQQQALLQQQQQQQQQSQPGQQHHAPPPPRHQSPSSPQDQSQADQSCLYNPDTGTYVCQR